MLTAAEELLADLLVLGVTLVPDGDRLRFRPRSAVTANLLARLQEHKIPLLALLKAVSAAAVQAPGRPAPSRPQVTSRVTGSTTFAQTLPSFVSAPPVFIDVETQSACDIKLGGRRYAADPTTRILSVVALIDGVHVVWTPSTIISLDPALVRPAGAPKDLTITACSGRELPPPLLDALHAGRPFCLTRQR